MSTSGFTPWHLITDDIILSWSETELVTTLYFQLLGDATRMFSKGYMLAQSIAGGSSPRQQELVDLMLPYIDNIMDTAHRMTIWICHYNGQDITVKRTVEYEKEVPDWPVRKLLLHVLDSLNRNIPPILQTAEDLSDGVHAFVNQKQAEKLRAVYGNAQRVREVTRRLQVWLSAHASSQC